VTPPRGVVPQTPGPGQESVWDYPRPPRLERTDRHLVVLLGGEVVAETRRGHRVLETSHPPGYYVPAEDVRAGALVPAEGSSVCEWKGAARYWTVRGGGREAVAAAWSYPRPTRAFRDITDAVAFYPAALECRVDGERVEPQEGGFYGGWITSHVVGPFKGAPGTWGW
jgi:uncharacterized protein (DUF427 family)